ncbi:MAG: FHA domain-containing protein [Anaerolineae bacterium]|nr:FHA domain-containing protein [Anaerolineae bacterium]
MLESARLVMSQGPQPGEAFTLDKDVVTLGRAPTNDIVINEPQVSRQHARILRQGNTLVIEDLGSTNGTFVNGMRLVGPHVLLSGDVIGLGDAVRFTYYAAGPAEPRTTIPIEPPVVEQRAAPGSPGYVPPQVSLPPHEYSARPEQSSRKWIWIVGGGCLVVLLCLAACGVLFVLDYLRLLPDFFYQPLFWLGLDKYFIR